MGLKLNGRYISLVLAVQLAYLVQAVRAAGKCDAVFQGFSNCVLKMGNKIATYPQDLDDKRNLETICRYWDDFHACTLTALTDCQEGVTDVWEKLKEKSKKLDYEGNLFVLCSKTQRAASSVVASASPLLLVALSVALATYFSF
ncbi:neuritin isoform X1 [Lacerta agilis]|uniref:Neuritin 1 n=1 Tax=Podarcis lilfordi TaxID=74358 RepID=A0AA35KKX6_9SAUR|nr:neuritin isoform X1 [Podarcis muralis]XP_033010402.1 neuritin isoform X1 [Lacerta agilis]XP_034981629.1 neuritin [Zootoca vivipara]XP_053252981.1 neuritin isoform X1 [Podarcis raffonei]CAI5780045.1 Neuritin 1 [Podarcis lilfordi]